MELDNLLYVLVVFLGATAICVMLFDRLGLGSVVGFIIAGVLIGPHTPGLVAPDQMNELQNIAQLGVVLFLFTVGLEMQPKQFWAMRRELFGLGWGQVLLTAAVLVPLLLYATHLKWQSAVMVGLGCAMSSTAVVMAILSDRGELSTTYGQNSFAILMAQDLSVVPVMALIPLLAHRAAHVPAQPLWQKALSIAAVLTGIVLVGRYVLPRALGWAARNRSDTAFWHSAFSGRDRGGLGGQPGRDIDNAGSVSGRHAVLRVRLPLSDCVHHCAIQGNLDNAVLPFGRDVHQSQDAGRGLADGAVCCGGGTDHQDGPARIPVPYLSVRRQTSVRTGFALSQVGEFSFVLFTATSAAGLLGTRGVTLGYLVISITMIATPIMIQLGARIAQRLKWEPVAAQEHPPADLSNHLIVVGLDEIGSIIAMMAEKASLSYVAIDRDYSQVARAKRAGLKAYYGDVLQAPVQEMSGISRARATFLSTIDADRLRTVALYLHERYPSLDIYARVQTLDEQQALRARGVKHAGTTHLESTLFRGEALLKNMGVAENQAKILIDTLRKDDYQLIKDAFDKVRDAAVLS